MSVRKAMVVTLAAVLLGLTMAHTEYPKTAWTPETITEEARLGINYFAESNTANNLARPHVIPKFTAEGYKKFDTPPELQKMLVDYLADCCPVKERDSETMCGELEGSTRLEGGIIDALGIDNQHAKSRLCAAPEADITTLRNAYNTFFEEWIGEPVVSTMTYGVRLYYQNASLLMHTDRIKTHVISAIINIEQDLAGSEDWTLVILDHNGVPHDVALGPGQSLLYESARLVHGRPYVFGGRYFANIFTHSRPVWWKGEAVKSVVRRSDFWANRWRAANKDKIHAARRAAGAYGMLNVLWRSGYDTDIEYYYEPSIGETPPPDRVNVIKANGTFSETTSDGHTFVFRAARKDLSGVKPILHRVVIDGPAIVAWMSRQTEHNYCPLDILPSANSLKVDLAVHNNYPFSITIWWMQASRLHIRKIILAAGSSAQQATQPGHVFVVTHTRPHQEETTMVFPEDEILRTIVVPDLPQFQVYIGRDSSGSGSPEEAHAGL